MGCENTSSDRRFRELFENIPDGVYETSPDGRILAANPALVRMLGFSSEEELRREGAADLYLDPAERQRSIQILAETGRLSNAELHLRRKDGSPLVALENARAVRKDTGEVLYYQGTLTDITDRKQAEQALRHARDQALEAARLKTQFLANMSHELRTPLNAVLGMAELLQTLPSSPSVRECAETIHLSAKLLLDHISEILDFSRIEAGRMELESVPFDLRELIHQSASILSARASDKGLLLLAWAEPDVPSEVWGDPARLQQILVNLLANAVKFTERGEVELRVSNSRKTAASCLLRFEVRDTGIGIPPSAREAIFEPFRQADGSMTRRFGGTGLGLAIVRELLSKMGSSIEVQSEMGSGSTFSFEIEVQSETAPQNRDVGGSVIALAASDTVRRVLHSMLESRGIRVLDALDCEDLRLMLRGRTTLADLHGLILEESALRGGESRLLELLDGSDGLPAQAVVLLAVWGTSSAEIQDLKERGATRLRLPFKEADLRRAIEGRARPLSSSLQSLACAVGSGRRNGHLLVAKDNSVNQTVIRRMLEKLGYSVELVPNGVEAVRAASLVRYDLILMDCQMPELDGFLATAAIRKAEGSENRRVPIIALTAHATAGDREACLAAGMDDYLSKPLTLADLARKLAQYLTQPPGNGCDGRPEEPAAVRE